VEKKKTVSGALILVESRDYLINEKFAFGTVNGNPFKPYQPFHKASVVKACTATLAGMLIDQGQLDLNDKITKYLDTEVLKNLFVLEGKDYSEEVTFGMLLNHTSGVADYFEDPASGGPSIKELILSQPNKFWQPADLLDFSRNFQKPVGIPGSKYHYSDTGYIMAGLIIERISGKSFEECLKSMIFDPLGMKDSYLMFYSEPQNPVRPLSDIWFNGVQINNHSSLSIDWAGGGIISTIDDLAVFIKALNRT
jgi:D-alanyl-D-alanine carboxypeptidase